MKPSRRLAVRNGLKLARFLATTDAQGSMVRWSLLLAGLLLLVNGLNIVNSYVGRDFMTSIVDRDTRKYVLYAVYYAIVFVGSAATGAFYRFSESRLRLTWRASATRKLIDRYLANHTFFRLTAAQEIDNPDQRITEDVKSFTAIALSIALLCANGTITCLAFLGVLWSIDPWLVVAAISYAAVGSVLTLVFGRPLVGLNNLALKLEAELRYRLIRVREAAEPIAVASSEPAVEEHLFRRLDDVVKNERGIISVSRNVSMFTGLYNYMIQLLPVLIVVPRFLHGKVEFGVVTQSAMAFSQVMGALSLIVTQFETLSSFAAVAERLQAMVDATEGRILRPSKIIDVAETADRLAFESLTLASPVDDAPVLKALTLEVPKGGSLLVTGPNPDGKRALFLAIAGIWLDGRGKIVRPPEKRISFLSHRPFTTLGPLREQLALGIPSERRGDGDLLAALDAVGLASLVKRVGGLDAKADWSKMLSLGDQQRVAFARALLARPLYAFLDHVTEGIAADEACKLLGLLAKASISCVSFTDEHDLAPHHNMTLELFEGGEWRVASAG